MHAARQACRPKHQVLVLKCYPKFQKNNVEVRANSSELSYLLYYASTRRSKLMKVGDFLDKRTTADVWKGRIGNVQVTLEILKALIEKCPRDLPLYAGAVLRVLLTILRSDDVTMVEETISTFETLCAHQDPASLAADQDYIGAYEAVVHQYAQFATKEGLKALKTPPSWPVAIRYRKAGLQALKAVAASESLSSETARQVALIVPAVLRNVYPDDGDYLRRLEAREAEHEKEQQLRRRQSISTVRPSADGRDFGDPVAAAGTTADADKLAEDEVGVIALQALKNIFVGVNRGQLRIATLDVINFIAANVTPEQTADRDKSWATTLMAMICAWAPVQDRYMILVSAAESLVRSPIVEHDMGRQLVLATVIDYLLSSSINFIGLSVMDVLVGLISHILLLLQLGGPGTNVKPHHPQTDSAVNDKENMVPNAAPHVHGVVMEVVKEPSPTRIQLLETLQKCMASLATHVYYSDQIADMVSAILARLKPSPMSGLSTSAEAIEDPNAAIKAVASSASLKERQPHVDKFFSFETGRFLALKAVKAIIVTANTRRPDGSVASVSRSAVGVRVWEGTQWLLRDPSGMVRKSYVDALVTWLNLEMNKEDLMLLDGIPKKEKDGKGDLARRAVSNASHREMSPKPVRNTFLALLHLAVYESALHNADSEPDYMLLHLLLTTLVNKLGINAVRNGLPMIWRLQEDIQTIADSGSKVMVGSLVHGYLWALSMALEFETSSVGRALHAEISRRNDKGLWLPTIRVPPIPLDRIDAPHPAPVRLPPDIVQTESLKPFDNRDALVDKIAEGYTSSLSSPPSSPPGSPSRSHSVSVSHTQTLKSLPTLPYRVQEELLADWSRDACIAANTKDISAGSMTGSRTATSRAEYNKNNYLGVAIPNGGLDSATNSPLASPRCGHSRPPSTTYGLVGRMSSPNRARSPVGTPGSTSSVHSAVRVDELKRVLSGSAPRTSYSIRPRSRRSERAASPPSSGSDSMVSVHSLSEASFITAEHAAAAQHRQQQPQQPQTPGQSQSAGGPGSPSESLQATPASARQASLQDRDSNAARERDSAFGAAGVPPVPPIPEDLRGVSGNVGVSPPQQQQRRPKSSGGAVAGQNGNGNLGAAAARKSRSLRRAGRDGVNGESRSRTRGDQYGSVRGRGERRPDFSGFLDSIDAGNGDNRDQGESLGVRKAPY